MIAPDMERTLILSKHTVSNVELYFALTKLSRETDLDRYAVFPLSRRIGLGLDEH